LYVATRAQAVNHVVPVHVTLSPQDAAIAKSEVELKRRTDEIERKTRETDNLNRKLERLLAAQPGEYLQLLCALADSSAICCAFVCQLVVQWFFWNALPLLCPQAGYFPASLQMTWLSGSMQLMCFCRCVVLCCRGHQHWST
jgi:hypothetical protein